jgi:hypothetical protein
MQASGLSSRENSTILGFAFARWLDLNRYPELQDFSR